MYTNNERIRIEHLTDILDVKDQAKQRIKTLTDSMHHWSYMPNVRLKYDNRIDTLNKVLERLDIRYFKVLSR